MTGSSRVVDHRTFSELQWTRDPFTTNSFILPPGFQAYSHLLGDEFVEVLKDVYALQCIRDSALLGKEDAISMAHIDNHQASIQSRLVSLPNRSAISECCHLAVYLCSAMLRCKIWRATTIPVSKISEASITYFAIFWLDCAYIGIVPPFIATTLQTTTSEPGRHMGWQTWFAGLASAYWRSFCTYRNDSVRLYSIAIFEPEYEAEELVYIVAGIAWNPKTVHLVRESIHVTGFSLLGGDAS